MAGCSSLTRALRMFGYGFLAVVLVLYLASSGLDPRRSALILTLTLVGDTVISLWLTTHADRVGRRRVLVAGALLMVVAGLAFARRRASCRSSSLAAIVGVISPTGNEVGPFLAVEQAALTQTDAGRAPDAVFAWYNLAGYVATAVGALAAGCSRRCCSGAGVAAVDAYRAIVVGYAAIGLVMAAVFARLGAGVEAPTAVSGE